MPTDIIVSGVLGRMGREIARAVLADSETVLAGCTEQPKHTCIGEPLNAFLGGENTDVRISPSVETLAVDRAVIIDFTTPDATCALLDSVKGRNGRMVIGTTGMDAAHVDAVRKAASLCPVVMSPNMGLGVNLLFYLTKVAAERIGATFDIEIVEMHHRLKKDSPSGTAKHLGEIAAEATGRRYDASVRHGRSGQVGARSSEEIGMHAVRGGDIVGDHTVLFAGPGERIELRHMAHSRATFAQGAVAAAKWLANKGPGLYTMRDVLAF